MLLAPELALIGDHLRPGMWIEVDADGRIGQVFEGDASASPPENLVRLPRRALLPGMINAHSHAFQRGLRGRGETFPAGAGSFWSWRAAMYELVTQLDEGDFRTVCLRAFREMLAAGITTVGEFHYFHHLDEDPASRLRGRCDELVLGAAAEAGIRIVLLQAYYRTGGIDANGNYTPPQPAQHRFYTESPRAYWQRLDELAEKLGRHQTLGVVAHSIRAAEPAEIAELWQEARRRKLPFHMHVEEQRQEIEACLLAHGQTPMATLLDTLKAGPGSFADGGFTAVHCTHTASKDMERFAAAGGSVCICPLTEANLGDGIADLPGMRRVGVNICLGTDSNARISMFEEMRWLEYVQRLAGEARGVVRDDAGDVSGPLWHTATLRGGRALSIPAGTIERAACADLITVDLDAPALAGCDVASLLPALVLGAPDGVIDQVCVGGRWRSVAEILPPATASPEN